MESEMPKNSFCPLALSDRSQCTHDKPSGVCATCTFNFDIKALSKELALSNAEKAQRQWQSFKLDEQTKSNKKDLHNLQAEIQKFEQDLVDSYRQVEMLRLQLLEQDARAKKEISGEKQLALVYKKKFESAEADAIALRSDLEKAVRGRKLAERESAKPNLEGTREIERLTHEVAHLNKQLSDRTTAIDGLQQALKTSEIAKDKLVFNLNSKDEKIESLMQQTAELNRQIEVERQISEEERKKVDALRGFLLQAQNQIKPNIDTYISQSTTPTNSSHSTEKPGIPIPVIAVIFSCILFFLMYLIGTKTI
jgi:chromosome segregation ATPase